MFYLSGLVSLLIGSVFCASNHHTGVEHADMHFHYDPAGHYLVAATTSRCYFVALNHDEQDHVHTNTGMEDLELKMLREMLGSYPETHIYHDDLTLTANLKRWCSTRDIFRLERSLDQLGTTLGTILG